MEAIKVIMNKKGRHDTLVHCSIQARQTTRAGKRVKEKHSRKFPHSLLLLSLLSNLVVAIVSQEYPQKYTFISKPNMLHCLAWYKQTHQRHEEVRILNQSRSSQTERSLPRGTVSHCSPALTIRSSRICFNPVCTPHFHPLPPDLSRLVEFLWSHRLTTRCHHPLRQ